MAQAGEKSRFWTGRKDCELNLTSYFVACSDISSQGAVLSLKEKPDILGDYFKWRHTPSKGNSVELPAFSDKVLSWWGDIQPVWRYKDEHLPENRNDYSFILAGGKKGVFLIILCLAWWDRAYGKGMESERVRRQEAVRAAGKDDLNLNDLPEHDDSWFNTVNDLIYVMERAQSWPVPGDGTQAVTVSPARRKRAAARGENRSSRKKAKLS